MALGKNLKIMESDISNIFFLENIIDDYIDNELKLKINFREHFIIGRCADDEDNKPPNPVGGMCLDIQSAQDNKFVVFVSSKFDVNNNGFGGSKITTWTDSEFRTIEEKRIEFLEDAKSGVSQKQTLYVGLQNGHMFTRHRNSTGTIDLKRNYPLETVSKLISEGSNFMLLRLLALHRYMGQFETTTLYIDGSLCRNVYRCTGPECGYINHRKTDVCRIYRTILEECGLVHESVAILTAGHGYLMNMEWRECSHVVHMNPLLDTDTGRMTVTWQDDMELYSEYLERKQICSNQNGEYVEGTPELNNILADYIQTLLQHKPSHVLDFTANYFQRYFQEFN